MAATASKPGFQQIQMIYLAMLAGQVLFAGVVLWLIFSKSIEGNVASSLFAVMVPAATIITIFVAYFLQNRRKNAAAFLPDLPHKLNHYRQSILISSALLEGGNLLAIVAALLTANTYYLLYFAIGLAAFVLLRPSLDSFSQVYRISPQEMRTLEK